MNRIDLLQQIIEKLEKEPHKLNSIQFQDVVLRLALVTRSLMEELDALAELQQRRSEYYPD